MYIYSTVLFLISLDKIYKKAGNTYQERTKVQKQLTTPWSKRNMTNDKQIQNTIKRPKDRSIRTRQKTEKGERGGRGWTQIAMCKFIWYTVFNELLVGCYIQYVYYRFNAHQLYSRINVSEVKRNFSKFFYYLFEYKIKCIRSNIAKQVLQALQF